MLYNELCRRSRICTDGRLAYGEEQLAAHFGPQIFIRDGTGGYAEGCAQRQEFGTEYVEPEAARHYFSEWAAAALAGDHGDDLSVDCVENFKPGFAFSRSELMDDPVPE